MEKQVNAKHLSRSSEKKRVASLSLAVLSVVLQYRLTIRWIVMFFLCVCFVLIIVGVMFIFVSLFFVVFVNEFATLRCCRVRFVLSFFCSKFSIEISP